MKTGEQIECPGEFSPEWNPKPPLIHLIPLHFHPIFNFLF